MPCYPPQAEDAGAQYDGENDALCEREKNLPGIEDAVVGDGPSRKNVSAEHNCGVQAANPNRREKYRPSDRKGGDKHPRDAEIQGD